MSPVLWLIGHPWPKEVAIHAAAAAAPQPLKPLSPISAPLPIGDAESDLRRGEAWPRSLPDVPHNSMRWRQSYSRKLLAKGQQQDSGVARAKNGKQGRLA